MIEIKVHVFASLSDFFPRQFVHSSNQPATIAQVIEELKKEKPNAASVLDISQVAVDATMVDRDHLLQAGENLFLLPPYSGG